VGAVDSLGVDTVTTTSAATFTNARKCVRCGHEWIRKPKATYGGVITPEEPKRCPRCRSEKWQQKSLPDSEKSVDTYPVEV